MQRVSFTTFIIHNVYHSQRLSLTMFDATFIIYNVLYHVFSRNIVARNVKNNCIYNVVNVRLTSGLRTPLCTILHQARNATPGTHVVNTTL